MELIEVIQEIIQQNIEAQKPADIAIGTVATASPVTIQISATMEPLPEEALILCDAVCERIEDIEISDDFSAFLASKDMSYTGNIGTVTAQHALVAGDKVVMIRVSKGQRYIVLSKI